MTMSPIPCQNTIKLQITASQTIELYFLSQLNDSNIIMREVVSLMHDGPFSLRNESIRFTRFTDVMRAQHYTEVAAAVELQQVH